MLRKPDPGDWLMIRRDYSASDYSPLNQITKDNVKDFRLVMKMSLDTKIKGTNGMAPPVVLGRIISYRGFKELAFVQSSSDRL